jgi:CRISPR-associated endonuclease Cas3-HD
MNYAHQDDWAHSAPVDQDGNATGPAQPLLEHLTAVGQGTQDRLQTALAHHPKSAWVAKAGLSTGLAHDIGKATDAFQLYLRGGDKAGHKMAGAVLARKAHALECALAIAGHHGGLSDWDAFKYSYREEERKSAHQECLERSPARRHPSGRHTP